MTNKHNILTSAEETLCRQITAGLSAFEKKITIEKETDDERLQKIWELVRRNEPRLFYVDFSTFELERSRRGAVMCVRYRLSRQEAQQKLARMEDLRSRLWQDFRGGGTDAEKTEYVHDYLAEHVRYHYAAARKSGGDEPAHSIEGALLDNMAVCAGIARAARFLLQGAGVESLVISGEAQDAGCELLTADASHAWNLNLLESGNYHMDITWDMKEASPLQTVLHHYCNVDDDTLALNHDWDFLAYPRADSLADNYFNRRGRYFRSKTALQKYARTCFAERQHEISFRLDPCAGFPDDGGRSVIQNLLVLAPTVSGKHVSVNYLYDPTTLVVTILADYQ